MDKNQRCFLSVDGFGDCRHRAQRFWNHWEESDVGPRCHDSVFRVAGLSDIWVQKR